MGNTESYDTFEKRTDRKPERKNGFACLEDYAAVGDGRSVALIAADGCVDWWCVPTMDSEALFDTLLDPEEGGYFSLTPRGDYVISRQYKENSNVLETTFKTSSGGVAKVTESLNSGHAGRLPWCELARRVEGISGHVEFDIILRPSRRDDSVSPWIQENTNGDVIHVGDLLATLRHTDDITDIRREDQTMTATLKTKPNSKSVLGLLCTDGDPLAMAPIEQIDERIDASDFAWRQWSKNLKYDGKHKKHVVRSALSLKFLLYSPSGAIAAAATTSLPERIGGDKNWDYRYAWVRDICLTIKAFLSAGALEESKAAFTWLTRVMRKNKCQMKVCYTLDGNLVPDEKYSKASGYKNSLPVRIGNKANNQFQLSMYGDILECATLFIKAGHVIDIHTARLLSELANQCADRWRNKDSGIWELEEEQHYTFSKIGCWLALKRAVDLAKDGHIEPTWIPRWSRERDRIREWIDENCWSESKQSYTFYAGTDRLDAAVLLTARVAFNDNGDRMRSTCNAVRKELGRGPFLYRYSGAEIEEGCFIACSFWLVEALVGLKELKEAEDVMAQLMKMLDCNLGLLNEMIDPDTMKGLGNFPQGLSHLSLVLAANTLTDAEKGKTHV
jgi:GH15 family glucan-1,4-alpha-glucosidase